MNIKNPKWDTSQVSDGIIMQSKKSFAKTNVKALSQEVKENLLSVAETSDDQFTKELCQMLKESNRGLMTKVFKFLGREKALNVYSDTHKI